MSAEKLRPARARLVYDWMGRYPRKGADWSPEEDQALIRVYESGRYLTKAIAARHLREPVAIERRLSLLRDRAQMKQERDLDTAVSRVRNQVRNWQTERETARQAITKVKGLFAGSMWPSKRQEVQERLEFALYSSLVGERVRAGDVINGYIFVPAYAGTSLTPIPLTDLPPEVAQALQFGGES